MDTFYEYLETATGKLELVGGDGSCSLVFEVKALFWREWVGEWTRGHTKKYGWRATGYDVAKIEDLSDKVFTWGRQCGLEPDDLWQRQSLHFRLEGIAWQVGEAPYDK